MALRTSNAAFLSVLTPVPLINTGWEVQIYDRNNFNTLLAIVPRWRSLKLQVPLSDVGTGSLTLDLDDSIFSAALPVGVSGDLLANENLIKCFYNGVLRQQFFMEEYKEGHVADTETRTLTVAGRASGKVLEEGTILPPGYPTYTQMNHTYTAVPVFKVFRALLAEAKARGCMSFVGTLFSDTGDTTSSAWTDTTDLQVPPGQDLLKMLERFREATDSDWVMNTSFQLDVRKNYGFHREDKVRFQVAADQLQYDISRNRRQVRNVILADSGTNGISQAIDSTSVTQWRRREAYVPMGDAATAATRGTFAAAALQVQKDEALQVTLKVRHDAPTRVLWADYDLGDFIGVDAQDTRVSGNYQVVALNIDVDDAGNTNLELTLHTNMERALIKLLRLMARITAGNTNMSSGAQAAIAPSTVVSQAQSTQRLGDLANVSVPSPTNGQVLSWNAAGSVWTSSSLALSSLPDVNTAGLADGVSIKWDAATSKWVVYTATAAPTSTLKVFLATVVTSAPTPVTDTVVPGMTLTIPGSTAARQAILSCAIQFEKTNTNRFAFYLDGVVFFPATWGIGLRNNLATDTANQLVFSISGVIVDIPNDNATHTVDVRFQASGDTNTTTWRRRSLVAQVL